MVDGFLFSERHAFFYSADMKNTNKILLTAFCFCSFAAMSQSNNNSSGQVPINADPASTPPPVQTAPATPPRGTEPNNKVMLKAQTDSMDSKRKTTPPPSQNVYRDTTRYLVHPGDTETVPRKK
jgi:hypothetical protein